jgi:hypothetical protein
MMVVKGQKRACAFSPRLREPQRKAGRQAGRQAGRARTRVPKHGDARDGGEEARDAHDGALPAHLPQPLVGKVLDHARRHADHEDCAVDERGGRVGDGEGVK